MKTPAEKHIQSRAKNTLKEAGILKCEGHHDIIDVTELKRVRDDDFKRMRNVGDATIEFINDFRKQFDWI